MPSIFEWFVKKNWGEALHTAAYLINRSPSVPLKWKCPESVFVGKPVSLSHLKVFGCSAFIHQKPDKLEPRSRKCVFLGYPEGVKGYRVWLRDEPGFKVTVSRDVVFNEFEFPCFSKTVKPRSNVTSSKVEGASSEVEGPVTFDPVPDGSSSDSDIDDSDNVHVITPDNDTNNSSSVDNIPEPGNPREVPPTNNDLRNYILSRDRVRRTVTKPQRFGDMNSLLALAFNVHEADGDEPQPYQQALKSMFYPKWLLAMEDEMNSLILNKT